MLKRLYWAASNSIAGTKYDWQKLLRVHQSESSANTSKPAHSSSRFSKLRKRFELSIMNISPSCRYPIPFIIERLERDEQQSLQADNPANR
jgi:hypothetical protein